jgi:hypothetical protein
VACVAPCFSSLTAQVSAVVSGTVTDQSGAVSQPLHYLPLPQVRQRTGLSPREIQVIALAAEGLVAKLSGHRLSFQGMSFIQNCVSRVWHTGNASFAKICLQI